MKETLLATKFRMPPLRPESVSRPRLTVKLRHVLDRKLTLVTAPAGFGKTTLVREWIESAGHAAAWLALDDQDNSPARFVLYVIHALREIVSDVGEDVLALLHSSYMPELSAIWTLLINELPALGRCILVLDDYHVIVDRAIHHAVDFLITHMLVNIHLVIISRNQPPLSLARLRSQAQLLELDSADLRFTAVEVEKFLTDVMHIHLSPADRVILEMRTEGWIAGVQLAGLSLQGETDPSAFIASFSGTDRHVADYLFEEVLRHQSDEVRHFLLHTSVVESLCSGLCDSLLERNNSQAMLEKLDQLHLFVVPLDRQRQWYRYHALFGKLLHHHITQEHPELLTGLHMRASIWYEQQRQLDAAIQHGIQAQDYERTAALIETAFKQRDWIDHDMHHLLTWFESLPTEALDSRPELILAYTWLLMEMFSDRWEQIEAHLRQVEQILLSPVSGAALLDEKNVLMLAQVDLLRANRARRDGQLDKVLELCQQALARLPEDETYIRSGTLAHLASVHESTGNTREASVLFTKSIRMCHAAGNIDGLLFTAAHLIQVQSINGQLLQAESVFEQIRDLAITRTDPDMGMVYISIGEVYREQNRLDLARDYLTKGMDMCRPFGAWRTALMVGAVTTAQVPAAGGHYDEAMNTLLDIEKQPPYANAVETTRLESIRTRLRLRQGNFSAAQWAHRSGLSGIAAPDYAQEFDILTFIRVLLAQASLEAQGIRVPTVSTNPLQDADRLLRSLYHTTGSSGRVGRVIEVCVLQALTYALRSETIAAVKRLGEGLILAEPEGFIRLFIDEGLPVYQLLTMLRTRPVSSSISLDYLNALRDAFPRSVRQLAAERSTMGSPLTESELNILRLLATERSIEQIAAELSIAVSTVRTYSKRIYSKLDAHSRAEAIYRAQELETPLASHSSPICPHNCPNLGTTRVPDIPHTERVNIE